MAIFAGLARNLANSVLVIAFDMGVWYNGFVNEKFEFEVNTMKKVSMCLWPFQVKVSDRYAIDVSKEIGLDGLDFSLFLHDARKEGDLYSLGKDAVIEYYTELKKYADEVGVKIVQTHGRMYGYGISEEESEAFVKNSELDALATGILGAKYCVVHTPPITWVGNSYTNDELYDLNTKMFMRILPFAKESGIKFAAETHGDSKKYSKMEFFGYVDNLIRAIEIIKSHEEYADHICVCVDTGHTNLTVNYGEPDVATVIRRLGSLIEVLHLHDNNGMRDEHKIPCTGIINWSSVIEALDDIGYSGYYNLENDIDHFGKDFEMEEAKFSVMVMRNLLK